MSFSRRLRRSTDTVKRRVRFLVEFGVLTEPQGTAVLAATDRGLSIEDALFSLGTTDIGSEAVFEQTMQRIERERPALASKIDGLARLLMQHGAVPAE